MIAYCWQVTLHSATMGLILYLWVGRMDVRAGRLRRQLLALLVALPLVTAAIPGRDSIAFAEQAAWLNSARLLAIPLPFGLDVGVAVAVGGVLLIAITLWQEVIPGWKVLRQSAAPAPAALVARARSFEGWERCAVVLTTAPGIQVATGGRPGRPRLSISEAALHALSDQELDLVLAHEHAHWYHGSWWRVRALFALRLAQSFNPVALWAFREYCTEVELNCDRAAVQGHDPKVLARVLLRIYHATSGGDVSAKSTLRQRIDVLLAGGPDASDPPAWVVPAVALLMIGGLPWLV